MPPRKKPQRLLARQIAAITLLVVGAEASWATQPATQTRSLLSMGLEDLLQMQISVSALSGRQQDLSTAAAAAYVFTSDDIAHSPAQSVPDLLRTVPGIQVAQIDANKWAISARGFNSRIASKLLVVIDGRNLYSPTFATVFWESEDLPLDQIERIEIIRGPGATIWGANAVNGVISITTKSSADTQGTSASILSGNVDTLITQIQHSGKFNESTHFRVYAKLRERDESDGITGGTANDDWKASRAGFRIDGQTNASNLWKIQGDIYNQKMNQTLTSLLSRQGQQDVVAGHISQRGSNLLVNWVHQFANASKLTTQFTYDYRFRKETVHEESARIYDLDLRWNNSEGSRHKITIGTGMKLIDHSLPGTEYFWLTPADETLRYSNVSFYDDISLTDNTIFGLSLKVENNSFTGTEYQPNLKLTHALNARSTIWTAVTRAVRVPSRAERDGTFPISYYDRNTFPGIPLPVIVELEPQPSSALKLDVETQISTELGWRYEPSQDLSLDLSLFFNQYEGLRNVYLGAARCEPEPACGFLTDSYVQPIHVGNLDTADSYGLELLTNYHISPDLNLESSVSVVDLHYDNLSEIEASSTTALTPGVGSPMVKVSSQLNWQIDSASRFTGIYRYVSRPNQENIGSYHVVDLMYQRQFSAHFNMKLAARNMGAKHAELAEYLIQQPIGFVEPSVHLQLDWRW